MRAIETRYAGPTNSRGSRIIVSAGDIHRTYGLGKLEDAAIEAKTHQDMMGEWAHTVAARMLCIEMKWNDVSLVQGETKQGYVFVMVRSKPSMLEALTIAQATITRLDKNGSACGTLDVLQAAIDAIQFR